MTYYGYARVSTRDQNEARQIERFNNNGITNIYTDKQSGKSFDRKQYCFLKRKLKKNDVLFVCSLDRFGRNYDEIQNEWRSLVARGVDIVVLDMPLLDTRVHDGGLTGKFISDLVLQILAYVAQQEREFIHKRMAEGIACAKQRGVKFGRPKANLPGDFDTIAMDVRSGALSLTDGAKRLNMKPSLFRYHFNKRGYQS